MSHNITDEDKVKRYVTLIIVAGLLLLLYDFYQSRIAFSGVYERENLGEGKIYDTLIASTEIGTGSIDITISEQALDEKSSRELFDKAIIEIGSTVLGNNSSLDYVTKDLKIKDSYLNGIVSADWFFDNYSIVNTTGEVIGKNIPKSGVVINASVKLKYYEYEYIYSFPFTVFPYIDKSFNGFINDLSDDLKAVEQSTIEYPKFYLPESYRGQKITWKRKMNYRGVEIAALGLFVLVAIQIAKNQEARKAKQLREQALIKDYPSIVSNLSILMGAGISFRSALERMCSRYVARKRDNTSINSVGYEELLKTLRQLKDGTGEIEAIENLGRRTDQKDYRKLSMLLTQNLKKGTRELIDMLEKEDEVAFEIRKQNALKAGEMASTKMLIPMIGMLGLVMIILIVPAVLSMNF